MARVYYFTPIPSQHLYYQSLDQNCCWGTQEEIAVIFATHKVGCPDDCMSWTCQPNFFTLVTDYLFFLMAFSICFIMITTQDKEYNTIDNDTLVCLLLTLTVGLPQDLPVKLSIETVLFLH